MRPKPPPPPPSPPPAPRSILALLRDRRGAREAIVLAEVLGPPAALR